MKNKGVSLIAIVIIVVVLIIIVAIGTMLLSKKSKDNDNSSGVSSLTNTSTTTNEGKKTTKKNELVYNDTKDFTYQEVDGGIAITQFKNYDYIEYDKIIIPSTIDGKTVVGIGVKDRSHYVMGAVFGNCEVVIPETVTYIAKEAFVDSDGLVKLSGGENVSEIGEYAFMSCVNLKEITFIDNVKSVADNAFVGCTAWEANH